MMGDCEQNNQQGVESQGDSNLDVNRDEDAVIVLGETLHTLPEDLYIPPQALRVFLSAFSGPLDLLLYLIKKQNISILDIPIAKITAQYVEYLELMQDLKLELAAEYLVMAAMLAEIKSKLLLPQQQLVEEKGEEDPRAELIKRLQEYERYKRAAEDLDKLPRQERDVFTLALDVPHLPTEIKLPKIELQDLLWALKDVLQRTAAFSHHKIKLESLSVRERMSTILDKLQNKTLSFTEFFQASEGKIGVVVTFLALLELLRSEMITIVQTESFGNIYLQVKS